jgi:hypothetical protein
MDCCACRDALIILADKKGTRIDGAGRGMAARHHGGARTRGRKTAARHGKEGVPVKASTTYDSTRESLQKPDESAEEQAELADVGTPIEEAEDA